MRPRGRGFVVLVGALTLVCAACGDKEDPGRQMDADSHVDEVESDVFVVGGGALGRKCNPSGGGGVPFRLVEQHVPALSDWLVPADVERSIGFGGTLLDFDGDGDVDIFQGGDVNFQVPPCMFENRSSEGRLEFARVAEYCESEMRAHGGSSVDLDHDGAHELVIFGEGAILWVPEPREPERNVELPGGARCFGMSAAGHDVDSNGTVDLLVSCTNSVGVLYWPHDGQGEFREPVPLVPSAGITLVSALLDVNSDGLMDAFVGPATRIPSWDDPLGSINLQLDPGGFYERASNGGWQEHRIGPASSAWGDPMGVARIWNTELQTYQLIVSDWGRNPVLEWHSGSLARMSDDLAESIGSLDGSELASWGLAADDLNRDGLDDVVVTQGRMFREYPDGALHRNVVALQQADGSFCVEDSPEVVPGNEGPPEAFEFDEWSSRAILRSDLDGDGWLDLVVFSWEGPVRVLTEELEGHAPSRCTLVPRPRYAHSFGYGYRLADRGDGVFRDYEILGQYRASNSDRIVTTGRSGRLMFPSGYIADFYCEPGQSVVIAEPSWVRPASECAGWGLDVDTHFLEDVSVVHADCMVGERDRRYPGAPSGNSGVRVCVDEGCDAVRLVIGDRYVEHTYWAPARR